MLKGREHGPQLEGVEGVVSKLMRPSALHLIRKEDTTPTYFEISVINYSDGRGRYMGIESSIKEGLSHTCRENLKTLSKSVG